MTYSALARCAEREERFRKAIYPNRVATGRMSEEEATYEIQAMGAIAAYFRAMAADQQHRAKADADRAAAAPAKLA